MKTTLRSRLALAGGEWGNQAVTKDVKKTLSHNVILSARERQTQKCAGRSLTASSLEWKELWFVASANFYGTNTLTLTMADFKLPHDIK